MPVNKKTGTAKHLPTANNLAGAAILSALTSPNQPIGKETGFNTSELVGFLNMRFSDAVTAYHDTNQSARPEQYECREAAWTNSPPVKGQMANGKDFLLEMARHIE